MIRNREILESFERALLRSSPPDIAKNQRMMAWMYAEACALGAMPRADKLGGIDFKINFARNLHVRKADRGPGPNS